MFLSTGHLFTKQHILWQYIRWQSGTFAPHQGKTKCTILFGFFLCPSVFLNDFLISLAPFSLLRFSLAFLALKLVHQLCILIRQKTQKSAWKITPFFSRSKVSVWGTPGAQFLSWSLAVTLTAIIIYACQFNGTWVLDVVSYEFYGWCLSF